MNYVWKIAKDITSPGHNSTKILSLTSSKKSTKGKFLKSVTALIASNGEQVKHDKVYYICVMTAMSVEGVLIDLSQNF